MKRALVLSGGGSRGSFQIGVWKYLQQMGWQPDIICGTSIGAINAAAIGSGMEVEQLTRLWTHFNRRRIYRLKLLDFLSSALFRRRFVPLMDTTPLRDMLRETIDFKALKKSRQEIIISAVNLYTAAPEFFNQHEITIDHLMASSAMPILFPWHMIDGMPYWDGGTMANTPLMPALAREMDEIIVVLLSPAGHAMLQKPDQVLDAAEHLLEQFLAAPYHTTLIGHELHRECGGVTEAESAILPASSYLRKKKYPYTTGGDRNFSLSKSEKPRGGESRGGEPRIITVAPSKMLGIGSLLNFSRKQAEALINEGYENARQHLKTVFF